jgi:heavy metal sensor kinase
LEHKGKPVGGVAVEESLAGVDRTLDRLRLALILGIPFALLLAGGGGWILAGRALEPVDRITRMARSITATDLSQRINLNRQDELGRLAGTFDEMIARLERAFQEQRQLAADVSHELRSPLTILEAQASLALRRSRTSEEYQQVLISVQEEVERMSVMVNQLLLLARAEAGEEPVNLEPTSLSLIAQTVVDGMRPLADDKGVALTLRANPAVWVQGDAARLRQLLLNLIDNALNHTPMGGRIEVTVGRNREGAFVAVEDTGEGIAPEDLPHIFQRFYRSDRARRRGTGNSGLGLAIVRWIVEAHGGQISVSSTPGEGASFVVSLRLASPAIRPLQPVT